MEQVVIHRDSECGQWAERMHALGYSVVNAPRPLAGEIVREGGPWNHGRFYAAGAWPEYKDSWKADDAYLVAVMDDRQMEDVLRAIEPHYDDYVARYAEIGMDGIAHMAGNHGLPHSRCKAGRDG